MWIFNAVTWGGELTLQESCHSPRASTESSGGAKKGKKHCLVLIQYHASFIDQRIMTQVFMNHQPPPWSFSLPVVAAQHLKMFTVYAWISAEIWETMSSEMKRDKVVKITSLTRRLGCLRHRRWGYCVGGRPDAGWCVWGLFWWHLWGHCCGVIFLLLPSEFPSKHREEVGEVRGKAIAIFFWFVGPDAIVAATIRCFWRENTLFFMTPLLIASFPPNHTGEFL